MSFLMIVEGMSTRASKLNFSECHCQTHQDFVAVPKLFVPVVVLLRGAVVPLGGAEPGWNESAVGEKLWQVWQ